QDILFEKRFDQGQHSTVRDVPAHFSQKLSVRNAVKVGSEVRVHNMIIPLLKKPLNLPERILTSATGAKPVTASDKLLLKDRFDHKPKGRLDDSIPYAGDTERPLVLGSRFVNIDTPDRPRPIAAILKLA